VQELESRQPDRVGFDGFSIDVPALELSHEGVPIDLGPAPVRALLYLARRAKALVTREELYGHLWPEGGVDQERALNAYIRQIRRALGEKGGEDRFIKTYPGRGYRFLRPVRTGGGAIDDGGWLASPMKAVAGITALLVTGGAAVFGAGGGMTRFASEAALTDLAPQVRLAFLTGSRLLDATMPDRRGEAAPHFRTVTTARPDFAAGHSGLAESLIWSHDYEAAAASARTALALDGFDARAHRALGTAQLVGEWDWTAAEQHLRRSVDLDPRSEAGRVALAFLLVAGGRDAEARNELEAAVDLAPVSPVTTGDIGTLFLWLGDAERALELCERTVAVEPDAAWGQSCVRRARAVLNGSRAGVFSDPDEATTDYARAIALTEAGRHEDALDALEASAEHREMGFVTIRALPQFAPLRSHPRYEALERRLFAGS
jgi:DNA-binding winged helix-turn-helix (wHTH) protein/thioredoxin-like negative regulator of GroEL